MKISVDPKKVAIGLSSVVIVLIVANFSVQIIKFAFGHGVIFGFYRVFDFNSEGNIPTFYSAVSLLGVAALSAIIAKHKFNLCDQFKIHWVFLSGIFAFLAFDEASELHELFVINLEPQLELQGVFFFLWVIPYGVLTIVFMLFYWRFWLSLPTITRKLFMTSAVVFLSGAIGVEMISSAVVWSMGGWKSYYHLNHVILYSIEEPLEMFGIVIFIYSLLDYIAKSDTGSNINIDVRYNRR